MAIPTITNNSPVAGSIAWGAFSIQLNGVVYSVAAGSTASRWVWWKFNAGAPVITAGADIPSTLVDDDLLLFANKNGIGARIQSSNLVDGEMLVDGSIFSDALSTNLINSQHIVTAGLDAGVIKFGTMNGDRISVNTLSGDRILARSLGADKLIISDFTNYIVDGDLVDPTMANWPNGPIRVDPVGDVAYMEWGNGALVSGNVHIFNQNVFEVKPGDEFFFTCEVSTPSTNTASVQVYGALQTLDFDNAVLTWPQLPVRGMPPNTGWTVYEGMITIPAGNSRRAQFDPFMNSATANQKVRMRRMFLQKKMNGRLVVDGTIVGTHLAADTITTRELGAGSVIAENVAAKAIDASRLNIGDLTNYVTDGDFRDPLAANWDLVGQPGALARVDPVGDFAYMEGTTATTRGTFFKNKNVFEAYSGDEFYVTCEISTPATNVDTLKFNLGLEIANVDGGSLLWRNLPEYLIAPNTAWTEVSGNVVLDPTDVATAWFNPSVPASTTANQKLRIRKIVVRKRRGGELFVDGTIQARHLEIDTVAAAIINTKILQSQLTITGNLNIAESNMGWSKSQGLYLGAGVVFYDDTRTNRIEGDLVTESLTVKDGLSIGGNADIHGVVVASNGLSTPTAKMSLGETWPKVKSSLTSADGSTDQQSIYQDIIEYDATRWLVALNYFEGGLRMLNKSDGSWAGDLTVGTWKTNFYPNGGLCKIGSNIYILGSDSTRTNGNHYIYQIGVGGFKNAERYVTGINGFGGKRVRLITDGTNVGMIWTTVSTGTLTLRWFNAALTAQVGSDITLLAGVGNNHVGGAHYGIGQVGGTARIWVSMHTGDSNMVRCWTTAGVRVPTEDFPRAASGAVIGLSYDPSLSTPRMVSVDKYGYIFTYSAYVNGGTLNAQYTYYDGDTANYPAGTTINGVDKSGQASGPHETAPSPVTSYALSKRAWPSIMAPPAPDELVTDVTQVDKANRLGVYASLGGTPILQSYLAKGVRSLPVTDALAATGTAAGASTVPSFATASVPAPGKLISGGVSLGSPTWELPGTGAGRMGPLRWDINSRPLNHGEWFSNTAQTCAVNTWTKRTGFAERHAASPSNGITYNATTGEFTLSQSGLYLVSAAIQFPSTLAAGRRIIALYENTAVRGRTDYMSKGAGDFVAPELSLAMWFPAGAVLSIQGYQTTAATTFDVANGGTNYCSITCLAAY